MVTKFLNVSTDERLSENSNTLVPSQKAVRNFIASKAIQLDFIQSVAPTTYTTGQKWLNTSDNKLYTAVSSSSWGTGVSVETDQFFTYEDLLYYFDGTSIKSYSTELITEQRAGVQLKTWLGTRAQYDALGGIYDSNTVYQVVESDSDYATLATQAEFNNSVTNKAATPYQVKQYNSGAYLPLTGGNLSAGAVLRFTNSNNQVSELAYNTSGYLTVSTGLYVTNTADVNNAVVRSGTIYKTNSASGVTAIWSDSIADTSTFGIVKPDGTSITINSGIISASGTGQLANTASGTDSLTILGMPATNNYTTNIGLSSSTGQSSIANGYGANSTTCSTAIGARSSASNFSVAIGSADDTVYNTKANGDHAISIGYNAKASSSYSIQIGKGTNSTSNTLSVGLDSSHNYQLLDSTGTIPGARLPVDNQSLQITNNKIEIKGPYLVETYHSDTDWYRLWSDGWCEQGGRVTTSSTGFVQVTFGKAFANTTYTTLVSVKDSDYDANHITTVYIDNTTTGFKTSATYGATFQVTEVSWECKGYAAEESN